MFATLSSDVKQYLIITGNYWAFTLTDGALRMLVVLYFHQLGYNAFEVASLFLFYEFFGVVTNLLGGWLGAKLGLNKTMNLGLFLQIVALSMLMVDDANMVVWYVMLAQALSGIAKDLNKMSAKSAIKLLVPKDQDSALYRWVAVLTGSKNALKGVGFFLGGVLLTVYGFQSAMLIMASVLVVVWLLSLFLLKQDLGKSSFKPKFKDLFSKSANINYLSAARLCLFASRDVWFVVALPVFLSQQFNWDHWQVGGFLASWVIFYGFVQGYSPKLTKLKENTTREQQAIKVAVMLSVLPVAIAISVMSFDNVLWPLLIGLILYAGVFAVNSSLHSFLIVHYADADGVSLDVGFYYMANASGRLAGTLLSGWMYLQYGIVSCLIVSSLLIFAALVFTQKLHITQNVK